MNQQQPQGRFFCQRAPILILSSSCRPGWEDIFRMNQKQLEAAIRRVSNDPTLEPQVLAACVSTYGNRCPDCGVCSGVQRPNAGAAGGLLVS